jgi:3-deoxy-D-manno-octulosonate 8-phosphate phosphatase KdsC-like HAD superfamily phosphatase
VDALNHLCQLYDLHPREICFVFDDVLDLSAAQVAGVRIMVPNGVSPLLVDYARAKGLADYTTYSDGHHHAVRETTELLTGISGHYDDTIRNRMEFSDTYRQYLEKKQAVQTSFFTADSSNQIQAASI